MSNIYDRTIWKPAVIADGAALSDAINIQGYDVVAIQQPEDTEGTAFTFQGSVDGLTFADVKDSTGTEVALAKSETEAETLLLGTNELRGLQAIKVRSGTSATPTEQSGDAVILVGLRLVE
jgi:hypothetical protein